MIKINYKIQFCLFALSLFFIGLGVLETLDEGLKEGTQLFRQISHFVPFVIGAIIFGNNLFSKKARSSQQ